MASKRESRIRLFLASLAVCLFVVLAAWLLRPDSQRPTAELEESVEGKPEHSASHQSLLPQPEAGTNTSLTNLPDPQIESVGTTTAKRTRRCLLTIRCVDDNGDPVSGAMLSHLRKPFGERWPVEVESGQDYATALRPHRVALDATDSGGKTVLDCVDLGDMYIYLESSEWSLIERSAARWVQDPRADYIRIPNVGEHTWTLTLRAAADVLVHVEYADGAPFNGDLVVGTRLPSQEEFLSWNTHALQSESDVVVPSVPNGAVVAIRAASRRPGFQQITKAHVELLDGVLPRLDVVIPATDEVQQGLILDLRGLDEGQSVSIKILNEYGSPLATGQSGPGCWTSPVLRRFRRVRASITGDIAWQSEVIEIADGEYRTEVVPCNKPATVVLRAIDTEGKPLQPAVATRNVDRYVGWRSPGRYMQAQSHEDLMYSGDKNGVIRFPGLPSGSATIRLEAPGKEPREVAYTATAGGEVDLGDVVLQDAEGLIEVAVEGAKELKDFEVLLLQPGGGIILEPVQVQADGLARIEHVACRKYVVLVRRKGAGQGWQQVVDLVQAGKKASLRFDVSQPR